MKKKDLKPLLVGQSAIEYLLMLGVLTMLALLAFRNLIPMAVQETNGHFQGSLNTIMGEQVFDNKLHVNGPFP